MHRGIISLILSGCVVAAATAAAAGAQAAPETKGPEPKIAEPKSPEPKSPELKGPLANLTPPMVFYVAKGAPSACGPGCSEWIAAEGTIDPAAEPRLWELLRKIGNDRKPPVYFHSPGGSVIAGLQIGRLLRARGLTVGVGWTLPGTCDRKDPGASSCDTLKRSGRELPAELDVSSGFCASACSYTILGGVVRNIGVGAHVGIHDVSPAATTRRFDENGRVVDAPQVVSAESARSSIAYNYGLIGAYLGQMGVSLDFAKAAHSVPADKMHELTRKEIIAFGIDPREVVENAWSLADKSDGMHAVKLIETRDAKGGKFHQAEFSLSCRDARTVRLQYVQQVDADTEREPAALSLTAGSRSFPLTRAATPARACYREESYSAELPLATLDAATFVIEAVVTTASAADSLTAPPARLAVQAAAPALSALARRCGSGAR